MATLLKTGNREVDEQHSVMQDCLSDLAVLLDGSCDNATLLTALETLHSYAEWHFTFEERLLERAKYPRRSEHVAEHKAIMRQLDTLRRNLASGKLDVKPLIPMVSHWIVDHVNNEDIRAVKHFEEVHPTGLQRERKSTGSALVV